MADRVEHANRNERAQRGAAAAVELPRVTLSSDDPAVFASSLTDELSLAAREMGLGAPALKALMVSAVEASFLAEQAIAKLTSGVLLEASDLQLLGGSDLAHLNISGVLGRGG